jgi:hypothetical protein
LGKGSQRFLFNLFLMNWFGFVHYFLKHFLLKKKKQNLQFSTGKLSSNFVNRSVNQLNWWINLYLLIYLFLLVSWIIPIQIIFR